jgi:hypothetical protein
MRLSEIQIPAYAAEVRGATEERLAIQSPQLQRLTRADGSYLYVERAAPGERIAGRAPFVRAQSGNRGVSVVPREVSGLSGLGDLVFVVT